MQEIPDSNAAPDQPAVANAPEPVPAGRTLWSVALYWARDLLVSIVLAIFVILFIYQPVKVEGTSMMPSLIDNERIFINKFIYRFGLGNIERGDLVVFWFPGDPSKSYIKRVIGVPGDTVEVNDGTVYLNGKALEETYVADIYRDHQSIGTTKVPTDQYFVLGDHRSSSNDSRTWGFVPRGFIYGKAVFVYWPPEKMGLLR